MAVPTPCYRHSRRGWIANCPDCTGWHLAAACARRDQRTSGQPTASRLPDPRWADGRQFLVHPAA